MGSAGLGAGAVWCIVRDEEEEGTTQRNIRAFDVSEKRFSFEFLEKLKERGVYDLKDCGVTKFR